jgi:uncharacterized heparinase superfamily protein
MPFGWYLAIARRPVARNLGALAYRLRSLYYATSLHELALSGRTPAGLGFVPIDPWPGNAGRGRAIMEGRFFFAGHALTMEPGVDPERPGLAFEGGPALWAAPEAGRDWLAELHSFAWLRDLKVAGGLPARAVARALILDWIAHYGRWRRLAWRPDILAYRVTALISNADFIGQSAAPGFAPAFLKSLTRQARHLMRAGNGGVTGARRLTLLKGQVFASLALFGGRGIGRILKRLEREVARQVLTDGGHVERSPAQQLNVLRDLVDIREILAQAGQPVPLGLQAAIDRMAPMLRCFRHGDGGLALFNDSAEGESWLIDMALTRADAPGKPLPSAPHTGFQRVTVNRTLLIADMGAPPPPGARDHTFAGTLSMEMSVGKERLIVNCGGGPGLGASWRQALRASAAHSTLTLADTNSTEIFESPGAGSEIGKHPTEVTGRMAEADGAVWLTGRHNGYVGGFGLIHERRLWLAPGGEELRGEDLLLPPGMTGPARAEREGEDRKSPIWGWRRNRPKVFHLRFHLHPGVSASLVHDGAAALLRLPSGDGWQFRAEGGNIALEDSVYLGSGEVKRSGQIVVSGGVTAEGPRSGAVVRWSIKRVAEQ